MTRLISVLLTLMLTFGCATYAESPVDVTGTISPVLYELANGARASCEHDLYLIIESLGRDYYDASDAYHHVLDVYSARCLSCGKDPIRVAQLVETAPHTWVSNGYECTGTKHTMKQICSACEHKTSYTLPCNGVHEDIAQSTRPPADAE